MGRASKRATKIRDASEFNLSRLQAELAIPRGETVSSFSWSLPEIFTARDAQLRGQFHIAARAAESMRTDDALFVAYGNRLAPQRCIQVEIVPANDKPKAISIAGEAEALYGKDGVGVRQGAFADINGCLVNHGVAFGVNVATVREDGSRIDLEHRYWPIQYVRWDSYRRQFVTRVDPSTVQPGDQLLQDPALGFIGAYEIEIIHGDGRWVIYTNHEFEPFKQEAALLPALAVWARHGFAIRDWSKGSVAHGNAKFVGELPTGIPLQKTGTNGATTMTDEAAAMLLLLRDLASADSPIGIRPAGSKSDFITNTSTAWQVWTELVGNGEKAAARIYLGTDGTLGTTGGAPGVDISELFGVAVTKVKGDFGCIERCFGTGVVEIWTALNFGDSSLAPSRKYMLPDVDEEAWRAAIATRRTAFFADIESARANGFVITQEYVDATAKEFDVTPPRLPEETGAKTPTIALAPTDLARVISVNEARASAGLGALTLPDGADDPDGLLTVEAFGAKKAAELAPANAAAAALSVLRSMEQR